MTKKDKISDIPSYSKLQKDVIGYSILGNFLRIFTIFSSKDSKLKQALSKLPELKNQTEHFLKLPDKFNDHFSAKGWIVHESMNVPIIEEAISFADQGNLFQSEEILSDYFTSTQIDWLLIRFKNLPEFSIRFNLIQKAYQDTIEKRYFSCIPLLLLIIDGITNDISKSKGFFSDGTDLSAWDSIAAHSKGLETIRDIFNETRKRTNTEEIFLPYRNGILHGRDINYGNKYVAGKCWCTLFAIYDWAQALIKQKKYPPVIEKIKTFKENLQDLKQVLIDYNEHKDWHKKITTDIENWRPRKFDSGFDELFNFQYFSPEKEVYELLLNWQSKKYGKIALQKYYFGQDINLKKEAGKIRRDFEDKILNSFNILLIKDEAPAISEITVEINYSIQDKTFNKEIVFRMICKSNDGRTGINGQTNINWKFIDNFIHNLYM